MTTDVHAHLWSEEYLELLARLGRPDLDAHRGLSAGASVEELRGRFKQMDSAGIDRQILSVTPLAPHFQDLNSAVEAARFSNQEYAELVERHPDRFAAFASLPLPHVEEALIELDHALDELGMIGVAVTTDILGASLSDPGFEPIFAALNERKSVLYVHPAGMDAHSQLIRGRSMRWSAGAPIEDTIAVVDLLLSGFPSRYPELRIIASHLGGGLPMILQRLDRQQPWESPQTPEPPSTAAHRLWFDTVAHGDRDVLELAARKFGVGRLLLGTDFPYQSGSAFLEASGFIRDSFNTVQAQQILSGNAARIFSQG
ncbi:amidohydrolase family protein [Psychromicrobium lacuslunae]|uniref:Amidohydrolase n=1 Tax=Psychromicrobium lacuslunae TaxID=1618207 RepID=A0A0D4BY96_9MICC|nr:amidohydrolase family protein [Psychromicrobium lacuslunae]AJT41061.1 amidohydrolase [Psychromicrobium lacuslunae]